MKPVVFSPALPAELLRYIVAFQTYPTTILICAARGDFLSSLVQNVQQTISQDATVIGEADAEPGTTSTSHTLLTTSLYQVAVSRHIRILFIPTISHLRAFLSIFNTEDSKIPSPPRLLPPNKGDPPFLLVYGFLALHRDTSEWSAQGISNTAAGLVEAAKRVAFKAVVVESKQGGGIDFNEVLKERVPVLTGTGREGEAWAGRTVSLKRVLDRWFRFESRHWDAN